MNKTTKIYDYTQNPLAETMEMGDKVYEHLRPQVESCIAERNNLVIDFTGITSLTTKFLNNAIGKLFLDFDLESLLSCINFIGLDSSKKTILKWSLTVALEKAKSINKANSNNCNTNNKNT